MSDVEELKRLIGAARRIVAFTGAGISTESGIPDFRSPGGIWTRYKPIEFQDFLASAEMRRESWRRKFATDETMKQATPNAGHRALARLVEQGRMIAIITQNIDGLHQASGVPEEKVIELHGNATYAACLDCKERYDLDWVREIFSVDERLPLCMCCGGHIKTATISFGQAMPEDAMERAHKATMEADLMVTLGSSLVVYPAAGFPIMAKRRGAKYVIINRDPTDQDELADLVINAEIGATMSRAVGVN
jgi:NAD-dependent deacetylase